MYVEEWDVRVPDNLSIQELTRTDLVQLHRVLATASDVFMSDRLRELRDSIFRFLSDTQ